MSKMADGMQSSGLALAGVQFFFTLAWTVYALMLPGLLATAGVAAGPPISGIPCGACCARTTVLARPKPGTPSKGRPAVRASSPFPHRVAMREKGEGAQRHRGMSHVQRATAFSITTSSLGTSS